MTPVTSAKPGSPAPVVTPLSYPEGMECPACRAAVADGARFCSHCGHAMTLVADERRVVTVLFADLVGFTSLSEGTDPEQVKNVVDRCFQRLVAVVESYGGKVDKIIGDAIVALFGAPVAHEDDAERAVRAGLRMQEIICEGATDFGAELELRVGVNTGEAAVSRRCAVFTTSPIAV